MEFRFCYGCEIRISYRDSLQNTRVFAQILEDPCQHTGSSVSGREDDAYDVVCNLFICEPFFVSHERSQQVVVITVRLPPCWEDFSQDLSQFLPCFHWFVKERSRNVYGHWIIPLLKNVVAFLEFLSVQNFIFSKYGQQCNIESVLQQTMKNLSNSWKIRQFSCMIIHNWMGEVLTNSDIPSELSQWTAQSLKWNRGKQRTRKRRRLCFALFLQKMKWKVRGLTVFISWKVLIDRPSQDCRVWVAMESMLETMFLMAPGMKARRTSFLNLAW